MGDVMHLKTEKLDCMGETITQSNL